MWVCLPECKVKLLKFPLIHAIVVASEKFSWDSILMSFIYIQLIMLMVINAFSNHWLQNCILSIHIAGHDGSMCNANQYGSMCDQILSIDTNVSQHFRSMLRIWSHIDPY